MKKAANSHQLRALSESEARVRAIFETVVDAIITIDERGVVSSFNPAAERMFGYKSSEVVGKNVSKLMPQPHGRNHDGYLMRYLRTGEARIIGIGREVVGRRRDGTMFPMDLAVSHVQLGKKHIFTGIARDVTERKKAEEMIASISEKERRQFGQELHDGLGQQITGLSLLAKALENKLARGKGDGRKDAATISALASRVLEEVRLQAHGLYPIELERHGLSAALAELAYAQERLFRVDCTYACLTRMPPIESNEALHLYRIAQEAVNNAIKHGRPKSIRLSIRQIDNALTLTIEDNGCGLPRDAVHKGGLGLSIMRYRANTLGAKMEFRRGARGGTVVTCTWLRTEAEKRRPRKHEGTHG